MTQEAWIRTRYLEAFEAVNLRGGFHVGIWVRVQIPGSCSNRKIAQIKSGELFPTSKPDLDNLAKIVLDALNGILWADDCQVVKLEITKEYGEIPGAIVQFKWLGI
jgi:Holliday junction resolvase RusA-like endonuclease